MKKYLIICFLLFYAGVFTNLHSQSFTIGGLERSYILHVPDNLAHDDSVPLVIALHYLGCTASEFETLTKFSQKADQEGFIVAYPQGIGNSWNAGGCCDPAMTEGVNDIEFIAALIDTISSEFPVDTEKVFVTGFSNGGIMAYALASEITDKLAGIAPVGALFMMEENHASKPLPIIHFHALDDGSVDIDGQWGFQSVYDLLNEWKIINGITADPDTFRDDSGIKGVLFPSNDSSANIILYTSRTGGHAWEINSRLGTTNCIWEFFSSHINKAEKITDTIVEGPRKRDYKIQVPSRYFTSVDESAKYPLVLAAHGWNSDAAGMETMTGFSNKANSKGFFVAYLHYVGPPPDYSWNYYMDEEKPDDIGFSKAVIDTMFARYPIDSSRIYVIGFSDGCGLANRLSQETNGLINATGTVGGMVSFGSEVQNTPVRMIHLHAKSDPSVSYPNVRNVVLNNWLETNDCTSDPDTIYIEQGYTGEMWKNAEGDTMVLFYTLPWSQHAWPVKDQNGVKVSATDMIWDFFESGIAIPDIAPLALHNELSPDGNSISIFPNPAHNQVVLNIDMQIEDNLNLQILQINGEQIEKIDLGYTTVGNNQYILNIEKLKKGYYFLYITGNRTVFCDSLSVQ